MFYFYFPGIWHRQHKHRICGIGLGDKDGQAGRPGRTLMRYLRFCHFYPKLFFFLLFFCPRSLGAGVQSIPLFHAAHGRASELKQKTKTTEFSPFFSFLPFLLSPIPGFFIQILSFVESARKHRRAGRPFFRGKRREYWDLAVGSGSGSV